jgi:hypothetical protein
MKNLAMGIQAFIQNPGKKARKKIQALEVTTDMNIITEKSFNLVIERDNVDMGWEKSFKTVPIAPGIRTWGIHTIKNNGLIFKLLPEGSRVEVFGQQSDKITIDCEAYAGAIGWTDQEIRWRELARMSEKADLFVNQYWVTKANVHYALIATAGAAHVIPYATLPANAGRLRWDIITLNNAATQLGEVNKDKGYGDTANMPFIIYADPIYKERLESAFKETLAYQASAQGPAASILFNAQRIYTFNAYVNNKILMVLPGHKLQNAEVLAPTTFSDQDILNFTYIQSVLSYYGAGCGDTEQVVEVTLG